MRIASIGAAVIGAISTGVYVYFITREDQIITTPGGVQVGAGASDVVGTVIDDRFEMRAKLGQGGMGTVYRAWQKSVAGLRAVDADGHARRSSSQDAHGVPDRNKDAVFKPAARTSSS